MFRLRRDRGLQADRTHVRVSRDNDTWADRYDVARAIARWYLQPLRRRSWQLVGRCWQCRAKQPYHKLDCTRR